MIGKIGGIFLKVLAFCLGSWLLSSFIITISTDFLNDYDIFNTEDHLAIITGKLSKKSLTGTPSYYVTVDLNEDDSSSRIHNKVFSWQFKRLDVGDPVKGHYIHGEHFFTTLDIVMDSVVVILFLLIFLFLLILLLCWPIFIFIEKREKQNKPPIFLKIMEGDEIKGKKHSLISNTFHRFFPNFTIWNMFFPSLLVIAILFTSGFVINGIQKFSPVGKSTTEALVINSEAKSQVYYYIGKYSDPYYSLSLLFTDENGKEFGVIKEVTRSIYNKHYIGDTINISYVTRNPHNIFIRDFSLLNLWETIRYNKFIWRIFFLVSVLIFFIIKFYLDKKKRK